MKVLRVVGVTVPLLLVACQEQRVVVMDQSQSAGLAAVARPASRPMPDPSPCRAPAGTGPYEHLTRPLSSPRLVVPARAEAEHVRGCAGVRFRIGPDGAPRDVTLAAEYPAGYGFGASALAVVAGARWAPRDDLAWHYLVLNQTP